MAELFRDGKSKILADANATESQLNALVASDELGKYRYLHFATHGDARPASPLACAVLMTLPKPITDADDGQVTAENLTATLVKGVARGKNQDALPVIDEGLKVEAKSDKPYAHPKYWAAFVLIGDPG